MANFPGPYEIRLKYTTTPVGFQPIQHTAHYNIAFGTPGDIGDPFSEFIAVTRAGGAIGLDIIIDDWVALLQPLLADDAGNTIDYAELWQYAPLSYDATFVSTYPIGVAGTGTATAPTPAGQHMLVFRTLEGGVLKINVLEPILSASVIDTPPLVNAAMQALADYVITPGPWLGRDTSYPFALTALYPGQNEALFKKRYRNI